MSPVKLSTLAKFILGLFLIGICFSCKKHADPTPVVVDTPGIFPKYDHVVMLILENKPSEKIIGSSSAPYINSLVPTSAHFVESYAIEHPSQPNYLDLYAGSNQGVTDNNKPPTKFTTANLGSQLIAANKTFATYSENLPSVGFDGSNTTDGYARKHNPAANWVGTDINQIPATTNQPFSAFPSDYNKLPTISIVIPSLLNDMHDGTIEQGDTWIKNNLGGFINWAATHNSLFILTFDEDDGSYNNHISTLFLGQHVKTGVYLTVINHFTVLRTLEEMFKLPYAGAADKQTPITNCWK